ncbi:MAG: metallophosphoesterase [Lachnospiraceae bacterium]|nr:metallophosphoesterase [Lachnospiraceae bacterium]
MIYVTGDTHGNIDLDKISRKNFPKAKEMIRGDYMIICGDFGFPFLPSDTWGDEDFIPNKDARSNRKSYLNKMEWLRDYPATVLWLDGNHDNHPFWYSQPVTEWNGGLVNIHPLADNVIHLKRGEYYTIDGATFWVMGGAESHDKPYCIPGYSWWEEEIPSWDEMNHGIDTLEAHDNQVDYILTHTMPQSLVAPILHQYFEPEPTRSYLDRVYVDTDFKYWYCGHMHEDINSPSYKIRLLYNDIVKIQD